MEKGTFKFEYKYPENYNPVYVNGAHGGISHKGELTINFFLEKVPLPDSVTHEINKNLTLGKEIKRQSKERNILIRHVAFGIILNLDDAKSIHQWLGKTIEKLEKLIPKKKESKK